MLHVMLFCLLVTWHGLVFWESRRCVMRLLDDSVGFGMNSFNIN